MLSKRIQTLSESLTIAISSLARDLKAQGKDVVSFSAGEPDFDTPQKIKDAAKKALDDGKTRYTAVAGTPEVLQAVADKLQRENGLSYDLDEIIVNNGAKHTLFNIFQALVDVGDEVIIPAPYWVTYPELVKYSGGTPVQIHTCDTTGFKITPKQLQDAITEKTKILILTTPSNPTGAVYSKQELQALADVLEGSDITVVSDEMYEKLVFGTSFTAVASINEHMYNRTITVNGLSKSVAMTGWRFGYMACKNKELVKAINKLQSQSTSNINSITQEAAIVGLDGSVDSEIEHMRQTFQKRCEIAAQMFNAIDGLSVVKPDGAFYLFVNCKEVEPDSMEFCKALLEKEGVATVPGVGFGADGYFRFSFAVDLDTIKEGISRIERFVQNYKK